MKAAIANAAIASLRQTASNIVDDGRRNIAAAGRFGAKWQEGLQFRLINEEAGLKAKVVIFHRSALAGIFEFGATISGKPLLWIPVTPGAPPPRRSGKRLISANVRGLPMLFDLDDRDRHRKPLYFGVPVAHIAKKWRIIEIAKEHVAKIGLLFVKLLRLD